MTDVAAILARDAELREKARPKGAGYAPDTKWVLYRFSAFDALVAEIERLREAIAWACGERDRFYSEYERKNLGMPIYWWRKELQRRALGDSEPTP